MVLPSATGKLTVVRIGEDAHRNPLMQNEKRKNLTILIVGETSRAEKPPNGYPRETNPRLAKDNVVYFPNTRHPHGNGKFQYRACSDTPCQHYKKKSWHSTRKACWISFSERASTCCGMTTMAAVKVPATRRSHQEHHRAESAWSVHQRRML
ncbi:hypothetical protein ACLBR5_00125 [Escherichia coli]